VGAVEIAPVPLMPEPVRPMQTLSQLTANSSMKAVEDPMMGMGMNSGPRTIGPIYKPIQRQDPATLSLAYAAQA